MSTPKYLQPLQNREEFTRFIEILRAEDVRSYLEIGSKYGGTLHWVAGALRANPCRLTVVDLPQGNAGTLPHLHEAVDACRELGHDVKLLIGDSTDPEVIEHVRDRGPYDAVFIDGNHTLPFVMSDWNTYGPMARIVAFHDIGWRMTPERKGKMPIEVPLLWDEIKAQGWRTQEIRLEPRDNGIGIVWMQ